MTKKEIMIKIRDFWFSNMGTRLNYLYHGLTDSEIIIICDDIIKVSKNKGIYTEDLDINQSCSAIPEMDVALVDSPLRPYLKRFLTMIMSLAVMCGKEDFGSVEKMKNKYGKDLNFSSKCGIIYSIREFKNEIFRNGGIFDKLIQECDLLDKQ